MKRGLLLLCLTSAIAGPGVAAVTMTAVQAQRQIHAVGASKFVQTQSPASLDKILDRVGGGDPAWLRVAVAMREGTDGANTEAIDGALSNALATNPTGVLRLIREGHDLSVDMICEDRAIEASDAEVRQFAQRTTSALLKVQDAGLKDLRDKCVASVKRTAMGSK